MTSPRLAHAHDALHNMLKTNEQQSDVISAGAAETAV